MKKKNLWAILATVIMALPLFVGFGGTSANAEKISTQFITLHKLGFDTMPDEIPNTGDKMDDSSWKSETAPKDLNGAIFTAYDVTEAYWNAYDSAAAPESNKIEKAEDAAMAVDTTGMTGIDFPATGTGTDEDGNPAEDGASTKGLPTQSLVNGKLRNAIYLFKETTSPAGVVQGKSVDFILGLPVYNADEKGVVTDEVKKVVHVYPKNEIEPLNLGFTKYGVDPKGYAYATLLPGAKFVLKDSEGNYYNFETGKFDTDLATASTSAFVSDENGKVNVNGLMLDPGEYIFEEIDSEVSKSTGADYHYGKKDVVTVTVGTDMEVTYTYDDYVKGKLDSVTTPDNAKAYNYQVPAPTKKAGDHDVNIGQKIPFTIEQQIPDDIANYSTFNLVDTYNANQLKLENTVDQIKAAIEAAGFGDALIDVVADKGKITISFDPNLLVNNIGDKLSFVIIMSVKEGASLGADITNNIELDNDFQNKTGEDTVKTYGKSFVKTDADTEATLNGAEFVIKKGNEYLVQNADGVVSWTPDINKATKFISGDVNGDGKYDAETDVNADGSFSVKGLAQTDNAGTLIKYELVETKAPDGYVLSDTPLEFTVDDGKVETAKTVVNKHKGSLPSTGGTGIIAFVAIGIVAVAGAVLYFTKGRRQIEG